MPVEGQPLEPGPPGPAMSQPCPSRLPPQLHRKVFLWLWAQEGRKLASAHTLEAWAGAPGLSLTSSGTLGKSLTLSVPQRPLLQREAWSQTQTQAKTQEPTSHVEL